MDLESFWVFCHPQEVRRKKFVWMIHLLPYTLYSLLCFASEAYYLYAYMLMALSSIQTQSFKFGALDVYLQQGPTYLIRSFHA